MWAEMRELNQQARESRKIVKCKKVANGPITSATNGLLRAWGNDFLLRHNIFLLSPKRGETKEKKKS